MSTWDDLRGWLDQRDSDHAAAVTAADHAGYARGHRYLTDLADYTYAHGGQFFLPFGAPSAPEAENREINTSPQVQAALKALAVKYGA